MSAPETTQSLATHLRRMADNAGEQIDADRLSRAADLVEAPQAVRVKPLVFNANDVAVGMGCRYLLAHDYDGWRYFQTSLGGVLENVSNRPFREKPDVIAAAQADYNARYQAVAIRVLKGGAA